MNDLYLDAAVLGQVIKSDKIQEVSFYVEQQNFNSIVVLPPFYALAANYLSKEKISVIVDYPYGCSSTEVKVYTILSIAKQGGAAYVDIIPNFSLFENEKWVDLKTEVFSCQLAAKNSGIKIRFVLEYKLYSPKDMLYLAEILGKCGVETLITATGNIVDDPIDNLVIAHQIQSKHNINCIISCSPSSRFLDTILKSKVWGVRFNSLSCFN